MRHCLPRMPIALAAVGVSLVALPFAAPSARAAEAYLCAGGRVVYVEIADLERMKRTDACIAGYYGLVAQGADVVTDAAAAAKTAKAPLAGAPETTAANVAVPPPGASGPPQFAARKAAPGRGPHGAAAASVRTITMRRPTAGAAPVADKAAVPAPAPETDYRNVRVINASADAEQWYRHEF